jgi:hypothetical protein
MLNLNSIIKKRKSNTESPEPARQSLGDCIASALARGLWQLMSVVVIVHLLGTVLIASLFVVTDVRVERLDRALEALNGSANQLYTLVLTLATPVTVYSSVKTKSSKEQ